MTDDKMAGGADSVTGGADDWRKVYPEEFHKGLQKFTTPEEFAKSYRSLETAYNESGRKDAIFVPKDDAGEADMAAFYTKLGRPEKPADYKLTFDEKDTPPNEMLDKFRNDAFSLGLNQKQAERYAAQQYASYKTGIETANQIKRTSMAEVEEKLRKEWGASYDYKKSAAIAMAERMTDAADKEWVRDRLANEPQFVRLLANMGRHFKEDTFIIPGEVKGESSEELRNKAKGLMQTEAYKQPFHADHKRVAMEVRELYQRANAS